MYTSVMAVSDYFKNPDGTYDGYRVSLLVIGIALTFIIIMLFIMKSVYQADCKAGKYTNDCAANPDAYKKQGWWVNNALRRVQCGTDISDGDKARIGNGIYQDKAQTDCPK